MDSNTLKLCLVQSELFWDDIDANLAEFEEKLSSIEEHPDIILLPEMFNTGFNFNMESAEPMGGKTCQWAMLMAKRTNALIIGSFKCKEAGKIYNRAIAVFPEGKILHYDKKHLFQLSDEKNLFHPGEKNKIIQYKGWNIALFICYDLRFPTWCRNKHLIYDLGIFVANWPKSRIRAWKSLLPARAVENQAYIAGVNIIGIDGMQTKYNGHSEVLQYDGKPLNETTEKEAIIFVELNKKNLVRFREKFPFHLDAD